ncbi:MAG TPA: hypothetical protein VHN11_01155, partial [Xanthobacteraceae bacterium]|nr:hypothetical protein [Xanthobacteraceae bacterium]
IPAGDVSGWIGRVWSINDRTPDKGIRLSLSVDVALRSGPLGIGLFLGNHETYGIRKGSTHPHSPTIISVGSPLYDIAANLRDGDMLRFSGTFIPFISPQACYDSISYSTQFALFRFTTIQRLGSGVLLK